MARRLSIEQCPTVNCLGGRSEVGSGASLQGGAARERGRSGLSTGAVRDWVCGRGVRFRSRCGARSTRPVMGTTIART